MSIGNFGKDSKFKFVKLEVKENVIKDSLLKTYLFLKEQNIIGSPEEFKKMCNNEEISWFLEDLKDKIKNLKWAIDFYKIERPEDFNKIIKNNRVRWMISYAKEENLQYILKFYEIKTIESFEELCQNDIIRQIAEKEEISTMEKKLPPKLKIQLKEKIFSTIRKPLKKVASKIALLNKKIQN